MKIKSHDVIRVGIGPARVTLVTPKKVDFIDETGQERSIDLEECAGNFPSRYVGYRDALNDPPWVVFKNEQRTRFEFKTYDEIYAQLLGPLIQAGWLILDLG